MKNLLLYITLLISLAACKSNTVEKPVWTNKKDILFFPGDSMQFTASGKKWKATLLSFTQPIPVNCLFSNKGLTISPVNKYGITEGPALLILENNAQQFYYNLHLQNKSFGAITNKDYRSPKTVNPDSGLIQHRMLHTIDEWRNILNAPQQLKPFFEDIIQLSPVAGTYRAQQNNALSSFYVQPGSATAINVTWAYVKGEDVFAVTAGPLKDKYNNTVANGTMLAFMFSDNEETWHMEAALLNGFARIKMPAGKNKRYSLIVKVNETISEQIQLHP